MRHYIKLAVFALLLLLAVFAPQGAAYCQSGATSGGRFDWVKGYGTSASYGCYIRGSVTDSVGNLYILGQFRNDSEWGTGWDSERLLPMVPYGPWADNVNVIIAKISPEGEMVWRKVIHSNNGISHTPYDIKKVGDTAFACLVQVLLPTEDHYTYYLDTLIPGRSDYPVKSMYVDYPDRTAFIMFDFEGNVIEQHFLYATYTDTAGNDFVSYFNPNIDPTPWLANWSFQYASFDIDNYGNIYISREASDYLYDSVNAQNGAIRGIKFWVDSNIVGQCQIENKPQRWYPQILKFSPHFDTLLSSWYVIQKNTNTDGVTETYDNTYLSVDGDNNIYFWITLRKYTRVYDTIIIDSTNNLSFFSTDNAAAIGFLVKYDSMLNARWLIALEDSVINMSNAPSWTYFQDLRFDTDSNLMFISASSSRGTLLDTTNFYSVLTYNGIPLSLKNSAFFLSFRMNDTIPELYSYGIYPSLFPSQAYTLAMGNLSCINNRVFLQSQYVGGVRLPSGNVQFENIGYRGIGLAIFDYQGRVIGGYDYQAISPNNHPGSILLCDSILYLSGYVCSDATFGNITLDRNGFSLYAYIAKYVDTAFMTPYTGDTGDTGDVNIMLTPDVGVFTAYPNPFRQRVNIRVENAELKTVNGMVTAMLTDIEGRSEEVPLVPQGDGRYVLDLTARPQASYYLTLTTADGHQHSVQLLKQSDRFGTD